MGWVSVKDRLPKSDWVLVRSKLGVLAFARFGYYGWEFIGPAFGCEMDNKTGLLQYLPSHIKVGPISGEKFDLFSLEEITHWMPLPEPPEEEDGLD